MAKKKDGGQIPFNCLPFNDEYLAHLTPAKPSQVIKLIKLFCRARAKGEKFLNYWDPDSSTVPMLLLIGTKGIGKSSIVSYAAAQMEYEIRRVMTGDGEAQDLMGVVDPLASAQKEAQGDRYNRYRFAHCVPLTEPEGKGGILLADDIGSLDNKQQKVFRSLITEGWRTGWFGEILAPRWNWIATSNPESDSYFLVSELEESLRDRCIPILMCYDQDEIIYYLSSGGLIPDIVHKFLLMNKQALDEATPRRWEQIGQLMFRHLSGGELATKDFINFVLRGLCPPGTVDQFHRFLAKGDDPDAYPMLTKDILNADAKQHKVHILRMKKWSRSGGDALVAATGYDMASMMSDNDVKLDDPQLANLAGVLETVPKTDLVQVILDAATGTGKSPGLVKHIKNRAVAEQLAAMQDRFVEDQQKAGL